MSRKLFAANNKLFASKRSGLQQYRNSSAANKKLFAAKRKPKNAESELK